MKILKRFRFFLIFLVIAGVIFLFSVRYAENVNNIDIKTVEYVNGRIEISGSVTPFYAAVDGIEYVVNDNVATVQVFTVIRPGGNKDFHVSIGDKTGEIEKTNLKDDKNQRFIWGKSDE